MNEVTPRPWRERLSGDWDLVRRLLIAVGVAGLAYLTFRIAGILLLVFAAILLAVIFNALAELLRAYARIPGGWALLAAVMLLAASIAGVGYVFGTQIGGQFNAVVEALPQAVDNLGRRLGTENASDRLQEMFADNLTAANVLPRAAGAGILVIGAVANIVLITIAAIYLATEPTLYRRGVTKLFHQNHQERVAETLETVGNALRLWFIGQLVIMVLVGALSGLAYWWVGLPAPIALGLIAGVTNFIPFLGPILGALPAVVFAFNIDTATVLWTLGLAVAIQQLESDVLTPLVQKQTVSLPPALALFTIVIFGVLFGFLGVLLAVPLTVTIFVAVKKLYVRETLGEPTEVPGETDADPA
ncbi:MAG: AI-2E family transporter [Proteobacteria bacterium]|nr:AI-2E family transporter [Pseudomonadota bacterium]